MADNDRLILHTVHTDEGATEVYWGRARDDMLVTWEGSILFHDDGGFTWKAWPDREVPVVVQIAANRVRVAVTEDQPPDADTWSSIAARTPHPTLVNMMLVGSLSADELHAYVDASVRWIEAHPTATAYERTGAGAGRDHLTT